MEGLILGLAVVSQLSMFLAYRHRVGWLKGQLSFVSAEVGQLTSDNVAVETAYQSQLRRIEALNKEYSDLSDERDALLVRVTDFSAQLTMDSVKRNRTANDVSAVMSAASKVSYHIDKLYAANNILNATKEEYTKGLA